MISPTNGDGARTRSALRLVGLVGLLVSAGILTGTWAGINLDRHLAMDGILTVLGIGVGLVVGLGLAAWLLYRESRNP